MRQIDQLLDEYGESHQNPANKRIHWICVPAIFFSIVGLLWSIPAGDLFFSGTYYWFNWAFIALLLVTIYYIRLSIPLAFGMMVYAGICMLLAAYLATHAGWELWQLSLVIFAVAWVGQFYGHQLEGKKPSFLKDLQFLLIGPAWLMHFVYKKLGIKY